MSWSLAQLSRRAVTVAGRAITARRRVLPEVFILGARKSGSTTLSKILWRHPAHVAPLLKENRYLTELEGFSYSRRLIPRLYAGAIRLVNGQTSFSLTGYRKYFPTHHEMDLHRARVGRAITSECDPINFYCSVSTSRIREMPGEKKFIIALRDPVARAYSDFNMYRSRAGERRSFSELVDREIAEPEQPFLRCFLSQGIYAPHIERWFDAFPRESFLVLRAEDLFRDSQKIAEEMFDFLKLAPAKVDCSAANVGSYSEQIDPLVERKLRDYFRPHNDRLNRLLGRDMLWS